MNLKAWIPVCAAVALLAGCGHKDAPAAESTAPSAPSTPSDPAAPGDTSTTPGGTAGEASVPPTETAPPETPPSGGKQ